jgi:DNA-binding transcriptional MerR regulator
MPSIENQTLSKLYYSIGEVAEMLQVNTSLLRFWEKEFNLTVSKKNKKGNRLFSVKEIEQIQRIYQFVKVEGYTLDGAKKVLKQKAPAPSSVIDNQIIASASNESTSKIDHLELIARLEKVKAQLLSLTIQDETSKNEVEIRLTPSDVILKTELEAPKEKTKKAPEKPKPASDMPTLFDF